MGSKIFLLLMQNSLTLQNIFTTLTKYFFHASKYFSYGYTTFTPFSQLPVPRFYWRVLHDPVAGLGVAIVGVNNPHLEASCLNPPD